MLSALGYKTVTEAQNIADALKTLESKPFQLVITDLHLKDGLGTELLDKIRAHPTLKEKNIPLIVMTSDMDKDSFNQAREHGITSYLLKPFSPSLLAERIAAAVK
jgi:two-component system chemotaxis response regulator CheY